MTICKRVRYSGRVQGVGFRYTAQQLAEGFPLGGYVKNLPNDDVELVAAGEAQHVESFLAAVRQQLARYIEKCEIQDDTWSGNQEFRIRY
jgi:acylphosphatase